MHKIGPSATYETTNDDSFCAPYATSPRTRNGVLGLTAGRHFLQLRAVSSASDDDLVRVASRALTAGLEQNGRARAAET